MATAGSIVVDLLMRTGSFETDTDRASKKVKKLGQESRDAAADVGRAFGLIAGTVAGSLITAGAAVAKWTSDLVRTSAEIEKLARLAGSGEQAFQRLAAGAATVGIQQDKLADIFKDTQDKLGDFYSTGGGAMKDFFDQIAPKVNLTADAFRNLSGPEVLQKYYRALEDAGASQADMVFYMEAIASDSAMLAPLLANNGEGFRKWGAEADRVGAILDGTTLAAMREVREQSKRLDLSFEGLKIQVAQGALPAFRDFVNELEAVASNGSLATDIASGLSSAIREITSAVKDGSGVLDFFDRVRGTLVGIEKQGNAVLKLATGQFAFGGGGWEAFAEQYAKGSQFIDGGFKAMQPATRAAQKNGVTLIDDGQMLPDSALKPGVRSVGSFRAAPEPSKDRSGENAAKRLTEALKSANEQMDRQIALYGDVSELSRVTYEIQHGGLQGIDQAAQSALLSSASLLDMLGNIDEAQAIMAEDAQKFADAFQSMFGIGDDEVSNATSMFGQFSASADQAARNMHDSFADFLFDPFADGTDGMVKGFGNALKRMAAEAAATKMFQAVGSWASAYTGAGAGWVNAIGSAMGGVAGGRAGGGSVAGGGMYRVGEGGRPELFDQGGKTYLIPGEAGSVRPITAGRSLGGVAAGVGAMKVEIINNGAPARVERAERSTGANGEDLLRLFIGAAADDLANGGQLAQAGKGRFDWQERV